MGQAIVFAKRIANKFILRLANRPNLNMHKDNAESNQQQYAHAMQAR